MKENHRQWIGEWRQSIAKAGFSACKEQYFSMRIYYCFSFLPDKRGTRVEKGPKPMRLKETDRIVLGNLCLLKSVQQQWKKVKSKHPVVNEGR